jgi:hypothetical protein
MQIWLTSGLQLGNDGHRRGRPHYVCDLSNLMSHNKKPQIWLAQPNPGPINITKKKLLLASSTASSFRVALSRPFAIIIFLRLERVASIVAETRWRMAQQ